MSKEALRSIPAIDQLLREDALQAIITTAGRENVRDRLREVLAGIRAEILGAGTEPPPALRAVNVVAEIAGPTTSRRRRTASRRSPAVWKRASTPATVCELSR